MSSEPNRPLVSLLEELDNVPGVRGSLVATVDGADAPPEPKDRASSLNVPPATDIAKTVRRMVVASATVGSAIEELLITFGSARMMIIPVREEATLTVMLERDSATASVRSVLKGRIGSLRQSLGQNGGSSSESSTSNQIVSEPEDEVDRLMAGELGPVLKDVQAVFTTYVVRVGKHADEANVLMREQMREWLLCCNPSPYTFPLLLDGLSQALGERPTDRANFMNDVQAAMRSSKLWANRR
jgi:predicted regulator of Ras-like GTPase activity (Roadblock/LC7/MglB family)